MGVLEVGKPEKVDENTLFAIASNTKAFTATAAALLDNEKKLSLDDKIRKWLPDFRLFDTVATEQVTIRDFLCHRAGLGEGYGGFLSSKSSFTRKQLISQLRFIKPQFNFRTKFGYCNMGYVITGEIIAQASKESWNEYIRNKFLKPLGMDRTLSSTIELSKASNLARPHFFKNDAFSEIPLDDFDNGAPAAAIYSSARDMAQWVIMQLDTGKLNGKQVVPANVILETWNPQMIDEDWGYDLLEPSTHLFAYGLGWGLKDYAGRRVIRHTGGVDGFFSAVTFVPEERLGIVVLTNGMNHKFHYALTHQLLDAYLNNQYKNWSQRIYQHFTEKQAKKEYEWKEKIGKATPVQALSFPLQEFAGSYENPLYGKIMLTIEGKDLVIHFSAHQSLLGKLSYLRPDTFLCRLSDPVLDESLVSVTWKDKQVFELTLDGNPWEDPIEYVFRKIDKTTK